MICVSKKIDRTVEVLRTFRKQFCLFFFLTNFFVSDMVSYISNEPYKLVAKEKKGCENLQELFNQEKPIYLQIKEMIETDILREIFMEEERVPSTNELAKLYAINPATAAKGINLLVDEGVLYKKRGIGMFVTAGAKELIRKKRKESFFESYVKGMLIEAASLGITKEELVEMIVSQKGEKCHEE